jgi:hypothetical protein
MTTQDVSPVAAWKKKPEVHTLPSGNKMRIARASLRQFLVQGLVPNALMTMVRESVEGDTNGPSPDELREVMGDSAKLAELMAMMDAVTIYCALEPRVLPAPATEADRDDDLLYVDELTEEDKTSIFNIATGTVGELEPFRAEALAGVGAVQGSGDVVDKPKRAPRSR